jgi:E3 ubiquitin-protein ligase LRSAM1
VEFEKDVMREKRETLTGMLMALMDQKEARQAELNDRLTELEKHKSQETDNYWLIQYQKLLDSKPKVDTLKGRLSTVIWSQLEYCIVKGYL